MRKRFLILLASLGLVIGTSVLPASAVDQISDLNYINHNGCVVQVGHSVSHGASFISDLYGGGRNQVCWAVAVRTAFVWGCGGWGLCFGWDQAVVGYENLYGYVEDIVYSGSKFATNAIPDEAAYFGARYWVATNPVNGACFVDTWNGPLTLLGGAWNAETCFTM